jgi:hypothetical protein
MRREVPLLTDVDAKFDSSWLAVTLISIFNSCFSLSKVSHYLGLLLVKHHFFHALLSRTISKWSFFFP